MSGIPSSFSVMDLKKLGRAIRTLRVRRGWRQEDLGRAVGVSRSVVWRVERGRRPGITIDTLDALAAALGASIDLVLRWEGEGLDRLLDEGHARLVDEVVRRLTGSAGSLPWRSRSRDMESVGRSMSWPGIRCAGRWS